MNKDQYYTFYLYNKIGIDSYWKII
jgi:hypothetical protein